MKDRKDKIDIWVGNILLLGSYLAAAFLLVGLLALLLFAKIPAGGVESKPLSFSLFFSQVKEKNPLAFVNLGILVMMLTPLFRVITAGFSFFLEKDYKYVLVASGVLIILLTSIISIFI
ncbi:MAG: hypothetical protein AMJ73_04695 [candidate division Zixibacteria bacterium SM1_73]|nr:MAG: hypothetical protein AMJ73_04695 [candidate division Zixibacteria bacterium SM1_73]